MKITSSIERLFNDDAELFDVGANEKAMTHMLGVYLLEKFSGDGWNVDCEYNRSGSNARCENTRCDSKITAHSKSGIYPDIICHKRTREGRDNNLFVIEVKKVEDMEENDFVKLKDLTNPSFVENAKIYAYKLGLFLKFDCPNRRLEKALLFIDGDFYKENGEVKEINEIGILKSKIDELLGVGEIMNGGQNGLD